MTKLALHPTTNASLRRFMGQPSHAVLLIGLRGIGKGAVAAYLAEQLLGLSSGKSVDHPYIRRISPVDGKAIGIEPVRELEHFLSLKVPGEQALKRAIIIEDSHLLGIEAQNALLKTLEEPPTDTVLILAAPTLQSLLPTIQSRAQIINVMKPAKADLQHVLVGPAFDSAYAISGGLPGLLHAMLANEDHPLLKAVATARQLLGQSSYDRLLQVDILAKDKQLALDTMAILQQMAHISLQTATGKASSQWQAIMRASYEAAEALASSGQPKLVLTNLCLQL